MSNDPDMQIEIEDRDLGPKWHLKAVAIIVVAMAVAYVLAVNLVLKQQ